MNRSSGIVIFSTAYSLCLVAIICCLQIKYDARAIHNDKLIAPNLESLNLTPKPPVQYVLMNPVTEDYPIQLDRPSREPSILIASLPAADSLAQNEPADVHPKAIIPKKAVALSAPDFGDSGTDQPEFVDAKQQGLGAWKFFNTVGEQIVESSFSLASNVKFDATELVEPVSPVNGDSEPLVELPKNASLIRLLKIPVEPANSLTLDPHLVIANDHETIMTINENLEFLAIIQYNQDVINNIKDELSEISENGSMDASICENSLYRILAELENLNTSAADENERLIDSVKSNIQSQINDWLDLLNGIGVEVPAVEPSSEEIDYEKLNTAINSFMWKRIF